MAQASRWKARAGVPGGQAAEEDLGPASAFVAGRVAPGQCCKVCWQAGRALQGPGPWLDAVGTESCCTGSFETILSRL